MLVNSSAVNLKAAASPRRPTTDVAALDDDAIGPTTPSGDIGSAPLSTSEKEDQPAKTGALLAAPTAQASSSAPHAGGRRDDDDCNADFPGIATNTDTARRRTKRNQN
ncbi:hypothetical protein V8E36_000042 [Tilletia maclaganii]